LLKKASLVVKENASIPCLFVCHAPDMVPSREVLEFG